jgi:hypothetical protein
LPIVGSVSAAQSRNSCVQLLRARAAEAVADVDDLNLAIALLAPHLAGASLMMREARIDALEAHVSDRVVQESLTKLRTSRINRLSSGT